MSFIRKAQVTVAAASTNATSGYTSEVNGLLIRLKYSSTVGIPSSGIKCDIGIEGSSLNRILFFEKLATGSTIIYPRAKVHNAGSTVLTSSGLDGLLPLGSDGSTDNRIKVCLSAASSANSTGGITFTFWYK